MSLGWRFPPRRCRYGGDSMEIMHRRVAGLDVQKETVVACVRVMDGRRPTGECRTFTTTTQGLLELLGWLTASRVTHVAMEATGVYWTPVWKILSEGDFTLIVANAAHIKQVPGRKTDMNDAMWIADLLACGLLKGEFRAARRDPRTALADAHPQATSARADAACPTHREDARRGQHQARCRPQRPDGCERSADYRSHDCRRARPAPAGGIGRAQRQGVAQRAPRRAAWPAARASPFSAAAASAAMGCARCGDPADR